MTSFLRSKFDVFDRRAVFITGDKIAVYHWRGGGLADGFLFEANDSGFAQFARYLEESPPHPVYLVVDVVEEEYRQDTIPHARGSDRRALIGRKLARLFRNTPYQYSKVQGREKEGRKDDRLLLTALTNPDQLDPIIRLFNDNKVPLAGIYSLPMLSERLLAAIDAKVSNVLLVTLHGASGLRQTFLHDNELKVSRLAKMPRYGSVSYGPHIIGELDKFRRYLVSLRLASPDLPIDVFIVTGGNLIGELRHQAKPQDLVRYHLVNVADLGQRLGISGALTTPYSDVVFAHLLLEGQPKNQYAPRHQTRYYRMHRTRLGMLAAAALTLFGATIWSGVNFIQGLSMRQQSIEASKKADFYRARYDVAHKRLPPTAVGPRDIDAAVAVADMLEKYKSSPLESMRLVSQALDEFPSLQLDKLDWRTGADPNFRPGQRPTTGGAQSDAAMPLPPAPGEKTYLYYQIAEIEGHIAPFDGDYREALALIDSFAETLRKSERAYAVEVVKRPLNVESDASLQGAADDQIDATNSGFAVRLVLGIEGEDNEKG
jgi:hypothetical protein